MKKGSITVAGLLILLSSVPAGAIPPVLRAGTHPFFASLYLGPAVGVKDPFGDVGYGYYKPSITQFKLIEEIGMHFTGAADGPALAFLSLQESFGNDFNLLIEQNNFWQFDNSGNNCN